MQTLLGLGVGALALAVFIWLLPILLILRSQKTNGAEKLFWVLAILAISWFAWIAYLLLAPISGKGTAH